MISESFPLLIVLIGVLASVVVVVTVILITILCQRKVKKMPPPPPGIKSSKNRSIVARKLTIATSETCTRAVTKKKNANKMYPAGVSVSTAYSKFMI